MLLPVSDVHITFQIFRRAKNALRAQTHIKKKRLFLTDAAKILLWERARTRICLVMYLKLENEAYRWKYAFLSLSISSLRLFPHSAPPQPPPSQLQWNLKLVFLKHPLVKIFSGFCTWTKWERRTENSKAGLQTYKKLYWLVVSFFTTKANNFSNLVVIDDVWFLAIISFVRFEKVFHFLGFNHLRESHVITFRIRMFLSSSSSSSPSSSSALVQIMFHFPRHILYPCIWIIWYAFTCNEETTTSHKKSQQWITYFEWKMTLGSYQIFRKKKHNKTLEISHNIG